MKIILFQNVTRTTVLLSSTKFHNSPQYPTAPYSVVPLNHLLLIQPVSNDKPKMSLKTSIIHTFVSD